MNDMGVLTGFTGILCHDHWKPYFKYDCTHALCNAHHIRELTWAYEQDGQQWANKVKKLLETVNCKVTAAGGALDAKAAQKYRRRYQKLLEQGDIECPEPIRPKQRQKRSNQKIKIEKPAAGTAQRL